MRFSWHLLITWPQRLLGLDKDCHKETIMCYDEMKASKNHIAWHSRVAKTFKHYINTGND